MFFEVKKSMHEVQEKIYSTTSKGNLSTLKSLLSHKVNDFIYYRDDSLCQKLSNCPTPPPPNPPPPPRHTHTHSLSFCCLVSLTEWLIALHLICHFSFNDIMDLHISSLVVPQRHSGMFYATRHQFTEV